LCGTTSLGPKIVSWDAMRSFLINKNLCFYYWLKKILGKRWALGVAKTIERTILVFGRDMLPYSNTNGMLIQEQELQGDFHEGIKDAKRKM
jgi:hypothetical protein